MENAKIVITLEFLDLNVFAKKYLTAAIHVGLKMKNTIFKTVMLKILLILRN